MYLAGGQSPGLAEHFLEKRRLYVEVLGDNIECEEMSVYAAARHCIAVAFLVCLSCSLQK